MSYLRLAMAQINVMVGDFEGNKKKILDYLQLSEKAQADVIIFPELCICGYPPEDLLLKPSFIEDNIKVLEEIRGAVNSSLVCIGFAAKDSDSRIYNAAAFLQHKEIKALYRKIHLPNYGVFDERRYFTPGDHCCLVNFGGIGLGITICEDIWYPDVIQELSRQGAQIVLNISASPYHTGKGRLREQLFKKWAIENRIFLAWNNLVGGQDELVFDGQSLLFDSKGSLLARGKTFEEDLLLIDLSLESFSALRGNIKEGKQQEISHVRYPVKKVFLTSSFRQKTNPKAFYIRSRLSPLTEITKALILGISDYVKKNGFSKVAIGLSGGIDSALTATLAVDALGAENVVGVIMPSQFSSKETQEDAKRLALNLQIHFLQISIIDIYHSYMNSLKRIFNDYPPDITEENLQARIRGNLLMSLSNKFGWLILTTGNKSETSVGYCTLYGDMAGGFAAIKDVPKTVVYYLSRYRNKKAGFDLIPKTIIDRAPSAELAPDQKDQDLLPPYAILDAILKRYVEKDESFSQIVAAGFDSKTVKKVITMVDRNEYKRRQSPPGIKITPRAFGKDRRMPISNKYWKNHK